MTDNMSNLINKLDNLDINKNNILKRLKNDIKRLHEFNKIKYVSDIVMYNQQLILKIFINIFKINLIIPYHYPFTPSEI